MRDGRRSGEPGKALIPSVQVISCEPSTVRGPARNKVGHRSRVWQNPGWNSNEIHPLTSFPTLVITRPLVRCPVTTLAVINTLPAVVRSAVIGRSVTGVEGDEEVVAFVQLVPHSPHRTTELVEHAARHLAPYKRPSQFLLVSAMPLTPTGKVVKDELARMAAHTALVH
jgi:hypothetical protein